MVPNGIKDCTERIYYGEQSLDDISLLNTEVVLSNPDCDVSSLATLIDIRATGRLGPLLTTRGLTFSTVSSREDGLSVDDGATTEDWLLGVRQSHCREPIRAQSWLISTNEKQDCLVVD